MIGTVPYLGNTLFEHYSNQVLPHRKKCAFHVDNVLILTHVEQLNDIHSTPIQSWSNLMIFIALLFSLEHPIQIVALILAVITSHREYILFDEG